MSKIKVINCGPAVTVQDAGRIGVRRFGMSRSGAMDHRAYRLANALVGADLDAAVLEFGMMGGRFSVSQPMLVAVTGGDCAIHVDGSPMQPWTSFQLEPDQVITIGILSDAVYGYIAMSGGINVPSLMGSRATHTLSGIGGFGGRCLEAGDEIEVFAPTGDGRPKRLAKLNQNPLRQSGSCRAHRTSFSRMRRGRVFCRHLLSLATSEIVWA